MENNELERIYCKNHHVVGVFAHDSLVIQHQRRKIIIYRHETLPVSLKIVCDRCGEEVKITLGPKKPQKEQKHIEKKTKM